MLVTRSLPLLCLASLTALIPTTALAQSATPIEVGRVISDSLASGGSHVYTMDLADGWFVAGMANQLSVDVVVKISGPDGETIGNIDGPERGHEMFAFRTKAAGEYRFEIQAFEDAAGSYTLELVRAEPIATDPAAKVSQMMAKYDGHSMPGVAVGVIRDGRLIFADSYGMANLTHSIPFSVDTMSNIGSISKQFTAFAIGLLAQEGKLSLDDDIRTYIPELPDLGHVVTIRHMLTHTTGYREFLNQLAMGGRQLGAGDYINRSEIVDMIKRQPELQNIPGAEFNYNNTSYCLLTLVVENITDQPFAEWMDENVFTPLGMDHTLVQTERSMIIPGRATGYAPNDTGEFNKVADFAASMGAGGMYSTVGDMSLWIDNMLTGEFGGKDLIDQMTTSFVLNDGDETGYGFGLFIAELRGLTQFHHGGADAAHRAMLMYFPEINAGVVTVSNNQSFQMNSASRIAQAFFEDDMDAMEAEDAAEPTESEDASEAAEQSESGEQPISPDNFDALVGDFSLEEMPQMVLSITRDGDTLHGQATGQPMFTFEPSVGNKFKIAGAPIFIEFLIEDDGTCPAIILHQNGQHKAGRVTDDPWAPSAEQLAQYAGRYFSDELETFYNIVIEEGKPVLRHRRFEVELESAGQHQFTGGNITIEFEVDGYGNVTGLLASSVRTKGLRFVKLAG